MTKTENLPAEQPLKTENAGDSNKELSISDIIYKIDGVKRKISGRRYSNKVKGTIVKIHSISHLLPDMATVAHIRSYIGNNISSGRIGNALTILRKHNFAEKVGKKYRIMFNKSNSMDLLQRRVAKLESTMNGLEHYIKQIKENSDRCYQLFTEGENGEGTT